MPLTFDLGDTFDIQVRGRPPLGAGAHAIEIEFESQPFGTLTLDVEDGVAV